MTDPAVTDPAISDPAWEPARARVIDSAEPLKALADPLRLRVLQTMMSTIERTWSVKEIAAELEQPVTKLYHHVKLLEGAALIRDVESRIVSGIVEHRYRASQRSLHFDDVLFGASEMRPDAIAQIAAVIDNSRDDLVDYLSRADADADRVTVARSTARLTNEEIAAIAATIEEMTATFVAARDEDRTTGPRTSLLLLMHPQSHDL